MVAFSFSRPAQKSTRSRNQQQPARGVKGREEISFRLRSVNNFLLKYFPKFPSFSPMLNESCAANCTGTNTQIHTHIHIHTHIAKHTHNTHTLTSIHTCLAHTLNAHTVRLLMLQGCSWWLTLSEMLQAEVLQLSTLCWHFPTLFAKLVKHQNNSDSDTIGQV